MSKNKVIIYDGTPGEASLSQVRGDTGGPHYFSVWYVDNEGNKTEPFDLREYEFAMHVRKYPRAPAILIDVPGSAFSTSQDTEAAQWEEDNEDANGRENLLTVKFSKALTKVDPGYWAYDIEFYPPDVDPEEKYTYVAGPYLIQQDITVPE